MDESEQKEIKKQLLDQIDKTFPEDKKFAAKKQIENMDSPALEEFLKKNNMIPEEKGPSENCIFCSIISGKIPSTKVSEDDNAIAILEINPISKGHTLVVPKDHDISPENLKEKTEPIIKKMGEQLKKFSPKDYLIKSKNIMGHELIDIIPVYNNETENSPRKRMAPEELAKIAAEVEEKKLAQVKEPKVTIIEEKKPEPQKEVYKWPTRIP